MILLDRKALLGAALPDLQETYLAVTGHELDTQLSVEAARVRVGMVLMVSADIVGHLGVPPGHDPKPMTLQQLQELGKRMNKTEQCDQELARLLKPGSMAHQLYHTQLAMPKVEPRPPRAEAGERRPKIASVRFTPGGESKPQAGSLRSCVLKYIQDQPGGVADVDAMEAALGYPVRGHIQKLIEKKHLTVEATATSTPAPAGAA